MEWQAWQKRLTNFLAANEITDADRKRAILLTVIGEAGLTAVTNLVAPDQPETKTYADLLKDSRRPFWAEEGILSDGSADLPKSESA